MKDKWEEFANEVTLYFILGKPKTFKWAEYFALSDDYDEQVKILMPDYDENKHDVYHVLRGRFWLGMGSFEREQTAVLTTMKKLLKLKENK